MNIVRNDALEHTNMFRRAESEESDDEGGIGNLNRLILRPPGHSGKAKKGHLCFDASFETGNLGRVDYVSEFEYDLFIRPDTCNPRYRFWFNFTIDNVRNDQRVIFNVVNFSSPNTLLLSGLTPLIKSTTRPNWIRLPTSQVFYYRSPHHGNRYVLSIALSFDSEEEVYQLALSYPYSYSRLQLYIDLIEDRFPSYIVREQIGTSIQKRSVDMLTVTGGAPLPDRSKRKKVIIILGRIHPGESPTSFVCEGLINFLVSTHPIAVGLREHLIFKVIPMVNPDGVFLGNERCSLVGLDLNRNWNDISLATPTLSAIIETIQQIDNNPDLNLDFVIDLHSHNALLGSFVYGSSYDDFLRFERHLLFPKIFAQTAEDFCVSNCLYNRDILKTGTARRFLTEITKNSVNVYSLFVSFMGFQIQGSSEIIPYDEEGYQRLGRNLGRTFFEYYKTTGLVSSDYLENLQVLANATNPQKSKKFSAIQSKYQVRKEIAQKTEGSLNKRELEAAKPKLIELNYESNMEVNPFRFNTNFARNRNTCPEASGESTPMSGMSGLSARLEEMRIKQVSVPSLSVVDFSSLAKTRKELHQHRYRRKNPSSL